LSSNGRITQSGAKMPIYEYVCTSCKSTFDLLRPMGKADEEAICPEGHPDGQRLISLVAAPMVRGAGGELAMMGGGACCAAGGCACHG
jgi:putative FmdB family regulatory protein